MAKLNVEEMEEKWKKYWEDQKIYGFDIKNKGKIYAVDTPPPTLSGEMHAGHAFSYSQQDFIIRYKRMSGFNVFYPFGSDDNGLPTEKLIQKKKGVKSQKMSREDFVKLCLETLKELRPAFIQDWKDIGVSCDYDLVYSTIDDNSRKISQKSFIDLYKEGLVYKKEFPTIWDTVFQTPVAQAELEDKEKETFFTTVKFECGGKELPIATTRPELIGACVAVFVNPKDDRYKTIIGKKAKVPLFEHEVPIIADDSAEIDKGTGVLMISTYGDKFDVDAVMRHKLDPRVILGKDGIVNLSYCGERLPVKDARGKVLEDLKESNLIIEQKKINHVVNVYEKSGEEIEFLPADQWFIKILDNKKKLIDQGKKINWYPEFMRKRYENWIEGLDWDWSISRERHFGVPIPAWHCSNCEKTLLAEESELPVDPVAVEKKCGNCGKALEPDMKVLDTWATSSLTPEIASSLVGGKIKVPFSLRPQAHDIIRTWAFYTIVKSLYHENEIPWEDIIISGFVTRKGEKMSKSKGNGITPKEIIKNYGSDALRYWASSSKLGDDLDYQEQDLIAGKKFVNKIVNAANFVFMNLEYQKKKPELLETDRLFLGVLNEVVEKSTEAFEEYNYSKARQEADRFFWQQFADNYLEIVKNRVYNGTGEEKASAFYTLYQSLFSILKMFAPITPFVCEEVYQEHFKEFEGKNSVHLESWPNKLDIKFGKNDKEVWDKLLEVIGNVRQAKSEEKKAMNSEIKLTLTKEDTKILGKVLEDLKSVVNAKDISEGDFKVEFL